MMNASKKLMACALALGFASCASARDLVWLGSETDNSWDLVTPNWYVMGDPDKTRVCFENNDNAFFLESEWVTPSTKLIRTDTTQWVHEFDVGAIVISNETQSFSWSCNGSGYVDSTCFQATSIDKYGAGDMNVNYGFQWNCDFTQHGGRFVTHYGSTHMGDYRNDTGSMIVSRTVSFLNSTFDVASGTAFGGAGHGAKLSVVFSNTLFKISQANQYVSLPKLWMGDTTFSFGSKDVEGCALLFTGDLTLGGTTPMALPGNRLLTFGSRSGPINITVPDLSGDDADDFIVNARICNSYFNANNAIYNGRGAFRKKGPGRMSLTFKHNTCTGDIEVLEGTLALTGSPDIGVPYNYRVSTIGPVDGYPRTLTVKDEGTLYTGNCCFGLVNTPMSFTLAVEPGGTLQLCEGQNNIGQLFLHGGDIVYTNGAQTTWIEYALMTVGKKLSFAGKPYDLNRRGTHNVLYLGYTLDSVADDHPISASQPHLTNLWSVVEMEVADVTNGQGVDAAIGLDMRDMVNMCYPTYGNSPNSYTYDPWKWCRFRDGIRKTGPGRLRLYGPCSYTHTTEVAEGALLVDSSIASSSGVTVDAGALLGGTGVVSTVTFKDGGGLLVPFETGRSAVLRAPSVAAEGTVCVRVQGLSQTTRANFRQNVLQVTGKPATFSVKNWTIVPDDSSSVNGYQFKYDSSTGIVSASYAGGLVVIVR